MCILHFEYSTVLYCTTTLPVSITLFSLESGEYRKDDREWKFISVPESKGKSTQKCSDKIKAEKLDSLWRVYELRNYYDDQIMYHQ